MNSKNMMGDLWTRLIVVGFAVVALAITGGSVFNIFTILSGDGIRAALVTLSFGLALVMFTLWTLEAIDERQRGFAVYTGAVSASYLAIGFAFLFLNGATQHGVLEQVDDRIRWVMQNIVWIPPTLTGLLSFATIIIQREAAPALKNSNTLKVLEVANVLLGIVGSMWGTGDAYYGLTKDILGATWLPFAMDAAVLGFIFIALKANDRPTFKIATALAFFYFALMLLFQLADGGIRLQNLDENATLKFVVSYFPTVIPLLTFGLFMGLLIVDKTHNGMSFGPRSAQNKRDEHSTKFVPPPPPRVPEYEPVGTRGRENSGSDNGARPN